MTVHAAKGLEFDVVFITGLEEGLFPHENATSEADGLEEERRLMYVAMTRARKRLYLSYAQSRLLHGQTRYCVSSRFFEEIPENLLHKVGYVSRMESYSAPNSYRSHASGRESAPAEGGLRIGQNVQHAKFGVGVIVSAEGKGSEARVQVNFGAQGMKWLALTYAKLEPC